MRKVIFASLLALTGLLTTHNTASAQVVYYSSGYTPYYYPHYGNTVYSTPGVTYYPYASSYSAVVPAGYSTSYYMPSSGVVVSSYSAPTYTYPYVYNYGYMPSYGGYYTRGRGWRWR